MATPTYDLIDSVTLSSSSSSINFTSIDTTTYRDLIMVIDGQAAISGDFYPRLRYNGVTSTVYSWVSMAGTGSSTQSYNGTENGQQIGNSQFFTNGTNTMVIANLLDAGATDKNKTILSRIGRANNGVEAIVGRADISGAITSIELYSANGNSLNTGTTIYLYGVAA
jgi:hypothetical protein